MHHQMSLRPGPFDMMASGCKRYELRLLDEKRRQISVGDTITFTCTEDSRRLCVRVISLHPFADFSQLYAALPLTACGYTLQNVSSASPKDMEAYYPPEKQAHYGVLAIGVERIRLPVAALSGQFAVRELTQADIPEMLRIALSNPLYYQHMGMQPTPDNLAESLLALPPSRTLADKHFFGWFDGEELVGLMDLVWRHPQECMAFIGWFMLDAKRQGCGLGGRLVSDALEMLRAAGVEEVRLGRVDGNPQSAHFWHKCGFSDTGLGDDTAGYPVVVMAKKL